MCLKPNAAMSCSVAAVVAGDAGVGAGGAWRLRLLLEAVSEGSPVPPAVGGGAGPGPDPGPGPEASDGAAAALAVLAPAGGIDADWPSLQRAGIFQFLVPMSISIGEGRA